MIPLVLNAVLLCSHPAVILQEEPQLPEATRLLADARAALGAPEKLARLPTMRVRGKASWVGMQGTGQVTEVYAGLHRAHVTTEFEAFGKFEIGCDERFVWERHPMGITIRRGWDGCEFLRRFGRGQHVDWKKMYSSARTVGFVEDAGVPCYQVELVPRMLLPVPAGEEVVAPPPDVWYLDAKTLLLRRVEASGVGLDGNATTVRVEWSDWREVEGIRYPHHLVIGVSGFTLRIDYDSYELGVELPPDYFALDEEVLAAAEKQADTASAKKKEEIYVETLEVRHIASIRATCKEADLQKTLSIALPEALHYVTSVGATMAGPPLVRYHRWGAELDVEAAMPITAPIEPKGRVKPQTLPAGEAAIIWHVGPYHELGKTHERLQAYLDEHGLVPRAACWEEYWTDPGMEPDPSKWRTKIVWPVKKKPVKKKLGEKGDQE